MQSQQKVESKAKSKIFTKSENTNKKRPNQPKSATKSGTSFEKKNEFVLILLGALLLTIIIFFFFFRSSESTFTSKMTKQDVSSNSFAVLEKRIQNIEKVLQKYLRLKLL